MAAPPDAAAALPAEGALKRDTRDPQDLETGAADAALGREPSATSMRRASTGMSGLSLDGDAGPAVGLYVRLHEGAGGGVLPLEVPSGCAVRHVARLVERRLGRPAGTIRLLFAGEPLAPATALADAGIGAEAGLQAEQGYDPEFLVAGLSLPAPDDAEDASEEGSEEAPPRESLADHWRASRRERRERREKEQKEANRRVAAGLILDPLKPENQQPLLQAVTMLRKALSREHQPPIQVVIDSGAVPVLVAVLHECTNHAIQFEAAWALTNVASGDHEQCNDVVKAGALPIFAVMVSSSNADLSEQAIWAIGNIAGDSSEFRDDVLAAGVLPHLLNVVNEDSKIGMRRNAAWAASNCVRKWKGKPPCSMEFVPEAVKAFAKAIALSDQDDAVVVDILWALTYLVDGSDGRITVVLSNGAPVQMLQRVVDLMAQAMDDPGQKAAVLQPACRLIGTIVTGSTSETQAAIDVGVIPVLFRLLKSQKKSLRKEACWAASNIAAGTPSQVETLVGHPGMFDRLCGIAMSEREVPEVRKEAVWTLSNVFSGGSAEVVESVADAALSALLCDAVISHGSTVQLALEGVLVFIQRWPCLPSSQGLALLRSVAEPRHRMLVPVTCPLARHPSAASMIAGLGEEEVIACHPEPGAVLGVARKIGAGLGISIEWPDTASQGMRGGMRGAMGGFSFLEEAG